MTMKNTSISRREHDRRYYQRHRDEIRERKRKWYEKNRERARIRARQQYRRLKALATVGAAAVSAASENDLSQLA